jgi:hypothetical protein
MQAKAQQMNKDTYEMKLTLLKKNLNLENGFYFNG